MIAGAIRPDRGQILLDGEDIAGSSPVSVARRGVIRAFEAASVFARMTVLENVLLGVASWRGERLHSATGDLSGGQSWPASSSARPSGAPGAAISPTRAQMPRAP